VTVSRQEYYSGHRDDLTDKRLTDSSERDLVQEEGNVSTCRRAANREMDREMSAPLKGQGICLTRHLLELKKCYLGPSEIMFPGGRRAQRRMTGNQILFSSLRYTFPVIFLMLSSNA